MNNRYYAKSRRGYASYNPVSRGGCPPVPELCEKKCGKVDVPDGVVSLAMVYSVSQCWKEITDCEKGLSRGTIFDELYKPFAGDKCKCSCGGGR